MTITLRLPWGWPRQAGLFQLLDWSWRLRLVVRALPACVPSACLAAWLPGWLASLTVEDHLAARVVCVVNVPMC